jgi:mRNA-degrading endonuclease toxin of MazEF toxin-antitoxin module
MTSNMRLADAPGNKQRLTEKVGRLPAELLRDVEAGIRLVLAL